MARMHNNIDDYISGCSPHVAPLLEELRNYIHATLPGATEDMQYGVPVFLNAHGVPVIYLFGSKRHVNFGFLRSADLTNPDGELRGQERQQTHPCRSEKTDRLGQADQVCQAMRDHWHLKPRRRICPRFHVAAIL